MSQPFDLGPESQDLFNCSQSQGDVSSDFLSDGANTFLQSQVGPVMAEMGFGDSYDNNNKNTWSLSCPSSQDLTTVAPAAIMPMGGLGMQNLQHEETLQLHVNQGELDVNRALQLYVNPNVQLDANQNDQLDVNRDVQLDVNRDVQPDVYQGAHLDVIGNNQHVEIPLGIPNPMGPSDGVPLSQSSVCSDDGIPPIAHYPGDYNFAYSLEPGTTKKCYYSPTLNKLFLLNSLEIAFQFRYDFEKCKNLKDMSVEGFLRYEKAEAAKFPVERCLIHIDADKKALEQKGARENIEKELELIPHFMKCTHAKAQHFTDEHYRCRVRVPLGRPQPGSDHVSRNFKFDCLSSCKVDIPVKNQSQKNPMVLVFELKEKKKVQGRAMMNLRVCSCPGRDFTKEENDLDKRTPKRRSCASAPGTSGGRRPAPGNEQDLERVVKQARLSDMIKPKPELLTPTRGAGGPEDDPFLSSQESVMSDDGILPENRETVKRKCRQHIDMTRYVLRLLAKGGAQNRFIREIGMNMMRDIRRAFKATNLYLDIHPERGSPDSGVSPGPNPDY